MKVLYSVSEISDKLNVSKVTVYSKLKLKELKPHVVLKEGKSFVTAEGFELIKQNLKYNQNQNTEVEKTTENEVASTISEEMDTLKDDLIESLKTQVDFLKEQIVTKDRQLENKDNLLENMQVLLKHEQEQQLPQLIASQEERDIQLVNKLLDSMEQHRRENQAEDEQNKKKRFFGLFKRK